MGLATTIFLQSLTLVVGEPIDLVRMLQQQRNQIEVVVMCTTTPKRLGRGLEAAIEGIFQQSVPPDRLVLSLPRGKMKFRDGVYPEDHELPEFLKKPRPGLVVDRDCEDMGPGTHMYNGLSKHVKRPDAFVIIIPDDHIFSKHHIAFLVADSLDKYSQGTVVGVMGAHSGPEFRPCLTEAHWVTDCGHGRVNYGSPLGPITYGSFGHVLRPWFFRKEPLAPPDATWPKECHMHDDLWLAALLARRGIKRTARNFGLPGQTSQPKQGVDALFWVNMRNLKICNKALLARFPGLWTPRPRVVVLGTDEAAASWCLGHVDEWHWLPKGMATLVDSKQQVNYFKHLVVETVSLEHPDVIAIVHVDAPCQKLSAAMQCALQKHDSTHAATSAVVCLAATGSSFAAAATVGAWRDAVSVHETHEEERRCWTLPNATWGHCCARYKESVWSERSRRKSFARSLAESQGFKRKVHGCPQLSLGCCDIDYRLSGLWFPAQGSWSIEYEDGRHVDVLISYEGLVHVLNAETKPLACPITFFFPRVFERRVLQKDGGVNRPYKKFF